MPDAEPVADGPASEPSTGDRSTAEPVPAWKARWNELLYEPDGDVLRNKLDLRDLQDLRTAEYRIAADR